MDHEEQVLELLGDEEKLKEYRARRFYNRQLMLGFVIFSLMQCGVIAMWFWEDVKSPGAEITRFVLFPICLVAQVVCLALRFGLTTSEADDRVMRRAEFEVRARMREARATIEETRRQIAATQYKTNHPKKKRR